MEGEIMTSNDVLPWVEELSEAEREAYEHTRVMNIVDRAVTVIEDLELMFGEGILDPNKVRKFAEAQSVVIRNGFEAGIQKGEDYAQVEIQRMRRELSDAHQLEITRLGGWG